MKYILLLALAIVGCNEDFKDTYCKTEDGRILELDSHGLWDTYFIRDVTEKHQRIKQLFKQP